MIYNTMLSEQYVLPYSPGTTAVYHFGYTWEEERCTEYFSKNYEWRKTLGKPSGKT
jgi:hypothetical protein